MKSKRILKVNIPMHFPMSLGNADGTQNTISVKITLRQGSSKRNAVKELKKFCWKYSIDFKEFCIKQNLGFVLQWGRGNYEYL